ncbi:MAG: WG repeat-containing protein [Flavobacteriia bacterium]|jgi:hypothetical protein
MSQLFKLFILCSGFFFNLNLNGQDTLRASEISIDIGDYFFESNCAHGHICCQVGCICCTQLNRDQVYDTIVFPKSNGIQRLKIVEHYHYANSHEMFPVHFRFKDTNGLISPKYYDVLNQFLYGEDIYTSHNSLIQQTKKPETAEFLVNDEQRHYFLLDQHGHELPFQYASHQKLSDTLYLSSILVNKQRIYGLTDGKGNRKGHVNLVDISPRNERGHAVVTDTQAKKGVMDSLGNVLISCRFNELRYIGADRYEVILEQKHGIIDVNGTFIYQSNFQHISRYSENLVCVQKDEEHIAYIGLQGDEIIQLKAEWGLEFQDGRAAVLKNEKWGYINNHGELVIDYQYEQALGFYNGIAPVSVRGAEFNMRWRLIDTLGKYINDQTYCEIYGFKSGYAKAFKNGSGYGIIDSEGKEFLPCKYHIDGFGSQEDWFIHDRMLIRETNSQKSALLITKKRDTICNLKNYIAGYFVQDLEQNEAFRPYIIAYTENGQQQLLNLNGEPLLKKDYRSVQMISPSLLCIYTDEKRNGFLYNLTTKKTILEVSEKDRIQSFENGVIQICRTPPYAYPEIYEFYNELGIRLSVYELSSN